MSLNGRQVFARLVTRLSCAELDAATGLVDETTLDPLHPRAVLEAEANEALLEIATELAQRAPSLGAEDETLSYPASTERIVYQPPDSRLRRRPLRITAVEVIPSTGGEPYPLSFVEFADRVNHGGDGWTIHGRYFYLLPWGSASTTLRIYYWPTPDAVSFDDTAPLTCVPVEAHEGVPLLAAIKAKAREQDSAEELRGELAAFYSRMTTFARSRQGTRPHRIRLGEHFFE